MPGRIYVKDGKMRQEFLDEQGHTITIVRRDKNRVWVIMPFERKYVEMPLGIHLPGQFLQIPPEAISKRQVCTEEMWRLSRWTALKSSCGAAPGGMRQTFWVAPKLGLPIKTVCRRTAVFRGISGHQGKATGGPAFRGPPGCQKVASP